MGDFGAGWDAPAPAPSSGAPASGGGNGGWGSWGAQPAPAPAGGAPAPAEGTASTITNAERSQRAIYRAVHLQDAYIDAANKQGQALQTNARAVVLSCDHLRAGHDLWAGRLRQLKKRVESLEKQTDWTSRHADATITKVRQHLGDATAYTMGAAPTAVVARPHPAVQAFYKATQRRVAALDEQMEELQAALGGAAASGTGTGGAAQWRNPSLAVKQALQNEHLAIRRVGAGPMLAFRGRLEECKERFTRMWREGEQARAGREAAAAGRGLGVGAGAGAEPLHRRDPFLEADRKQEAVAQLRALEQQSRLGHGEGAFGATDSELEDLRRAALAARDRQAASGGGGAGGTSGGSGWGTTTDSGWGTGGGGSSSGWDTGGGSGWGASGSSGGGGGWGTTTAEAGWGTTPAPAPTDPMARPQGSLRRSGTRPRLQRQRAGGF